MSKIITHTANGSEWLVVEVPKDSEFHYVYYATLFFQTYPNSASPVKDGIDLPLGDYTIHCIAEDATDEQAVEVVGKRELWHMSNSISVSEMCSFSGCTNKAGGNKYAMLYEGAYCNDYEIAAGMPVCDTHYEDGKIALSTLILHHFGVTDSKHVILKKHV